VISLLLGSSAPLTEVRRLRWVLSIVRRYPVVRSTFWMTWVWGMLIGVPFKRIPAFLRFHESGTAYRLLDALRGTPGISECSTDVIGQNDGHVRVDLHVTFDYHGDAEYDRVRFIIGPSSVQVGFQPDTFASLSFIRYAFIVLYCNLRIIHLNSLQRTSIC